MPRKKASQSSSDEGPGAELASALGLWHAFLEHVRTEAPTAEIVWKTYAGKTGRQCVIRGKERNLAYLKPGQGSFLMSTALSDEAVASLGTSTLPRELIEEIEASPKYMEGTPGRVRVDSARSLQVAQALLSLKVATDGAPASKVTGRVKAAKKAPRKKTS